MATTQADKIVTFMAPAAGSASPGPDGRAAPAGQRDWSSALDLIQEASDAIRISEERASDLDDQIRQLTAQATEEIRLLEAKVAAGERRLLKVEERALAAEARAEHAEAWLVRLHDAVVGAFTRPSGRNPGRAIAATADDDDDRSPARRAPAVAE